MSWLILALGAFFSGASKGGLPGVNMVGVILFAQVLPAKVATGALLPLLIVADLVAVLIFRRKANWRELWRVFPWTALGVLFGWALLGRVDDTQVRRMIGAIILALAALQVWRARDPEAGVRLVRHPATAAVTGVLAGFTTMIANAAGPIMSLYLLAMNLPKLEFAGFAAWFFLVVNTFKLPFMIGLGLIPPSSLGMDAALAPVAVAGALGGRCVLERLPQAWFEGLVLVFAVVGGLRLLFA